MQSALVYLGGGKDAMPRLRRIIKRLHRILAGEDPRRVEHALRALEDLNCGVIEDDVTRATVLGLGQVKRALIQVQMLMAALKDFLAAQPG